MKFSFLQDQVDSNALRNALLGHPDKSYKGLKFYFASNLKPTPMSNIQIM